MRRRALLLFPGQGVQRVGGMLPATAAAAGTGSPTAAVERRADAASSLLARAEAVLRDGSNNNISLAELMMRGPQQRLDSTELCQPAIFVASAIALEHWQSRAESGEQAEEAGEEVYAAAGLSLGEYTALYAAGSFSFEDGVRLTQARGRAMQAASEQRPSAMVSVTGTAPDSDVLQEIMHRARCDTGEDLCVANMLASSITVIAGGEAACLHAMNAIACAGSGNGARAGPGMLATRLPVSGAFHTEYMHPAVQPLWEALHEVPLSLPRIPVVCNRTAQPYPSQRPASGTAVDTASATDAIRNLLVEQLTEPVRWHESLQTMLALSQQPPTPSEKPRWVELGPGNTLSALVKRVIGRRANVTSSSP